MTKRERNYQIPLDQRRLLSVEDASDYLNLGLSKTRDLAKEAGAYFKAGRRVLVDRVKLDRYLDQHSKMIENTSKQKKKQANARNALSTGQAKSSESSERVANQADSGNDNDSDNMSDSDLIDITKEQETDFTEIPKVGKYGECLNHFGHIPLLILETEKNHSINCLKRAGYETIEEVLDASDKDLLKIRGVGDTSLADIRQALQKVIHSYDALGITIQK